MHTKKQYSDEHLNAFIDDELDSNEQAEILDAIRHDAKLSQRVCKLQKLHNLVQLSYESVEVPERHNEIKKNTQTMKFKGFAAASLLFAIGSVAGWVSHQALESDNLTDIAQITQNPATPNNADKWKLMLHVSTADPHKLNIVLNEAEALLDEYAKSSRKLKLEILTNSKGLALVSNNGTTYNKRLQKLQNQYDNLAVMVCGETLKRIQRTKGKKLNLLPNITVVPSAIDQIVNRQQNGWSYIRI